MVTKSTKRHKLDCYDWDAVKTCIRAQEVIPRIPVEGEEGKYNIPADAQMYFRFQRFLRKNCSGWPREHRNRLRDAAIDIAKQFDLNPRSTIRLMLSLSRLTSLHSIGDHWETRPRLSAVSKTLGRIEGSVQRVASFWDPADPRKRLARSFLFRSAASWASAQDAARQALVKKRGQEGNSWARARQLEPDRLAELGFDHRVFRARESGVEHTHYGESEVVRRWFEFAPLILQFVKNAQRDIETKLKDAPAETEEAIFTECEAMEISAQERLVGRQLPRLYERVTGCRFGSSKSKDDRTLDTTGVKFVRLCLGGMGLPQVAPETVASHWKRQKKTTPTG
jgi:hypothetical protein